MEVFHCSLYAFSYHYSFRICVITYHYTIIPLHRPCNNLQKGNSILKHHTTLLHWSKEEDNIYNPRVDGIRFSPCKVVVTGLGVSSDGCLLKLLLKPGDGFDSMVKNVESALSLKINDKTHGTSEFHITIAVDRNKTSITALKRIIESKRPFPFSLNVIGLDLYQIWNPFN